MPSTIQKLTKAKLIKPPKFLVTSVQYEVIMGSVAYGVSNDNSDTDIYGFCIPDRNVVFPHLDGHIQGFGKKPTAFNQYQQHHVKLSKTEYDLTIYSIIKYFQLTMECNPNMIDSLFVPRRCIIYSTQVGEMVREARHIFLHKGAWHKFKGYAYSQLHKARNSVPEEGSTRFADYKKHGYSTKFAYHVVRLLDEVEQILTEEDIDLTRNREQLKSIRRGEWEKEQIVEYFDTKEKSLEQAYLNSKLRNKPNEKMIKDLLLNCLEQHYGTIEGCVTLHKDVESDKLNRIMDILNEG